MRLLVAIVMNDEKLSGTFMLSSHIQGGETGDEVGGWMLEVLKIIEKSRANL